MDVMWIDGEEKKGATVPNAHCHKLIPEGVSLSLLGAFRWKPFLVSAISYEWLLTARWDGIHGSYYQLMPKRNAIHSY